MQKIICPSMMCADFTKLKQEVHDLEHAGTDIFHIDIMDGSFVPNFGMGLQDFEMIRNETTTRVDVHLMIQNPSQYVQMFAEMGADIIYIHPESETQVARTLDLIHQLGKKAGIAINPGTSFYQVVELLPLVDYVMIMTVNPGFAGQKYLDYVNEKIKQFVEIKSQFAFELMVDGAISRGKITSLSKIGVDGFVLGTSALFGKEESYKKIIEDIKK
ncbi:ribulose-phosphate 3-epimerase [Enterococcus sulfureus]